MFASIKLRSLIKKKWRLLLFVTISLIQKNSSFYLFMKSCPIDLKKNTDEFYFLMENDLINSEELWKFTFFSWKLTLIQKKYKAKCWFLYWRQ